MVDLPESTAPPSDIKSRPQYGVLRPVPTAQWNVVVAEGVGIKAVLRLMGEAPAGFAQRSQLVYTEAGQGTANTHDLDVLQAFGLANVDIVPATDQALRLLERYLDSSTMGTRLYTVGSESFVGQVVQHASNRHLDPHAVMTELSGSLARRVQCVHCKVTTEQVTMSVFDCPGCGVALMVRDHYSRRLAAFQGVSATAEDPDDCPVPEELYR